MVLASHGLRETDLSALLRRAGLHAAQLDEWRAAAATALEPQRRRREKVAPHPDTARLAATTMQIIVRHRSARWTVERQHRQLHSIVLIDRLNFRSFTVRGPVSNICRRHAG